MKKSILIKFIPCLADVKSLHKRFSVVFFSIFICLSSATVIADTRTEEARTEEAKIKKTGPGNQLLASLPQACHLTGEFSQAKLLAGFEEPIKARGDFFYSCERGLIWRTTAPIAEAFVYHLEKSAAKVSLENTFETLEGRSQKHLGKLLNNLIGGNREYLLKTFTLSNLNDTLILEPRKRRMRKFIESINIVQKNEGAQITLYQRQGEKLILDIVNAKEHKSLSPSNCTQTFHYSAPACRYLFE